MQQGENRAKAIRSPNHALTRSVYGTSNPPSRSKSLGLAVPTSILIRADKAIE